MRVVSACQGIPDCAAFLDQPFGVQPGDFANLLVLGASPVEDIRHTEQIAYVIYRGQRGKALLQ